jgi:hypothetical protein
MWILPFNVFNNHHVYQTNGDVQPTNEAARLFNTTGATQHSANLERPPPNPLGNVRIHGASRENAFGFAEVAPVLLNKRKRRLPSDAKVVFLTTPCKSTP